MKGDLEKELIQINKQLVRLRLQQQHLEKRLKEVQDQIADENETEVEAEGIIHYRVVTKSQLPRKPRGTRVPGHRPRYTTAIITGDAAYDGVKTLRIGDFVRIINPKAGQPNKGTIKGFCADGKAKICCAGNVIITRQIKNIRYHVFE